MLTCLLLVDHVAYPLQELLSAAAAQMPAAAQRKHTAAVTVGVVESERVASDSGY